MKWINGGITSLVYLLFFTISVHAQVRVGLKQVLTLSRLNNPVLKTQKYDINAAEADIITARLRPNPEIQNMLLLIPSSSQRNVSNNNILSPLNTQPWLQMGTPLRLAPKRKYAYKVASYNLAVSKEMINEAERNLANDVANQWLNVWLLRVNLDLVNKARVNIDTLVSINELRLKNQVITETDLLRTSILAEQYRLQQNILRQQLIDELNNLKFMLGGEDTARYDIDMEDPFMLVKINSPQDSLINYALQNRSDIKQAMKTISVANMDIKLQHSLRYPDPFVAGIFNPQNGVRYVGYYVNVQIPIFNRNQGEFEKSKVVKQQSESNLLAVQLKIRTEVTISFQEYMVQKNNIEKYSTILSQSVQVLNTVRYSYIKGHTTIIDLLEAQRTWYDTQKLYFEAMKNYRMSYIDLLYTTGMINEII